LSLPPVKKIILTILLAFVLVFGVVWNLTVKPDPAFPTNSYFIVEEGKSLSAISTALAENKIIRSPLSFKVITTFVLMGGNDAVAGDYFFEKPLNVFAVAWRIIHGTFVINPIKITIPEGLNKFEIATIINKNIPTFDIKTFTDHAKEGYMFPDTYYFVDKVKPNDVLRIMKENFDRKIKSLKNEVFVFKKPLDDVIRVASILELEASLPETRRIIAGIIWKRLAINMPLQVDVTFKYINGKGSFELTKADLAFDSAYNTYKYTGLPPTAISNPGLDAINAAIRPTDTKYLYFLSDRQGIMHYAITFEEHKKNRDKYLGK